MDYERESVGSRGWRGCRPACGFTLIEMMITVAILGVVAVLAWSSYASSRPRQRLTGTVMEIQLALSTARQKALGEARDVAVLFYPKQGTSGGMGRAVVVLDGYGGFMAGAAPPGVTSFCEFDAAKPNVGGRNEILDTVDFPPAVTISPPKLIVPVSFPYSSVPYPGTGCSFCDAGLTTGAIRFDSRGRASFFSTCGAPGPSDFGGSIAFTSEEVPGSYVLVVTPTGIVKVFNAG